MPYILKLKKSYRNWLLSFIWVNFVIVLLAISADPYRLYPMQLIIPGMNDIKPRLYDYQRGVKLFDIAYQKPKTIILGSSRVLFGIDPQSSFLKKYPPVYNAGILGASMIEVHNYFLHALANQPHLKRVILALDFYEFNSKFDRLDPGFKDIYGKNVWEILKHKKELLVDFHAIFSTLWDSLLRKPVKSIRQDGRLTPDPLNDRELYKDFFAASPAVTPVKMTKYVMSKKPPSMKNEFYKPYHLSDLEFAALKDIVETCKKRQIELYIYMPPTFQNSEIMAFHQLEIWQDFETFQRRLAGLHAFWDFNSWNAIILTRSNFVDGTHHVFPVGDLILSRILGYTKNNTSTSFGRYVNNKNIEQHLDLVNKEYRSNIQENN